jgi:hypothetical protein
MSPSGAQTPDALRRLGRRSTRIILAMASGPRRDQAQAALGAAGFLRVETIDTLDQALTEIRTDRSTVAPLLMLEAHPEGGPTMASIRALQKDMEDTRELMVAMLVQEGPVTPSEDALIRSMRWPTETDTTWLPIMDELAGLD